MAFASTWTPAPMAGRTAWTAGAVAVSATPPPPTAAAAAATTMRFGVNMDKYARMAGGSALAVNDWPPEPYGNGFPFGQWGGPLARVRFTNAASGTAAAGAPFPCFHSGGVRRHAGGAHRRPPPIARHARCGRRDAAPPRRWPWRPGRPGATSPPADNQALTKCDQQPPPPPPRALSATAHRAAARQGAVAPRRASTARQPAERQTRAQASARAA